MSQSQFSQIDATISSVLLLVCGFVVFIVLIACAYRCYKDCRSGKRNPTVYTIPESHGTDEPQVSTRRCSSGTGGFDRIPPAESETEMRNLNTPGTVSTRASRSSTSSEVEPSTSAQHSHTTPQGEVTQRRTRSSARNRTSTTDRQTRSSTRNASSSTDSQTESCARNTTSTGERRTRSSTRNTWSTRRTPAVGTFSEIDPDNAPSTSNTLSSSTNTPHSRKGTKKDDKSSAKNK